MAQIIVRGQHGDVLLFPGEPGTDDEDTTVAFCRYCGERVARYDTMDDATEYAGRHADTGRPCQ
jgi:hypothetical protein